MKKVMIMALAAVSFAACNDNRDSKISSDANSTSSSDTVNTEYVAPAVTYTPAEGDVTYRDDKVLVYRNGQWVATDDDVRLDNGVVVYKDGTVKKEGKEVRLKDSEVVTKTGKFFDKAGNAIENAWDATKEGAKEAGKAVENAGKKVGDKAKDAVDDDDKDEKH